MSAIEAYRAYLGDVVTFPIDRLDRLGVPVWAKSSGAKTAR